MFSSRYYYSTSVDFGDFAFLVNKIKNRTLELDLSFKLTKIKLQ